MKKHFLILLMAAALAFPALALARSGGFTGPNESRVSVAEALKLPDDADVSLSGRIEKQVGHEKYQFSDSTGVIILDIADKRWRGLKVGPEDLVSVFGEIDRNSQGVEVEVKRINKM